MNPSTTAPRAYRVHSAEFEASATTLVGLPAPDVDEVAFAGRSNVGKSSLMNALVERKGLVRTSSTPGCTRALNLFRVAAEGAPPLRMLDLPGYGYAKLAKAEKAKWGAMIEGYLSGRPTLRVVVVLVDVRRGYEEDDAQLVDYLGTCRGEGRPLRVILVATKVDKVPLSKRKPMLESLKRESGVTPTGFSAETGEGREELWGRIARALHG
jgi:GTP-binding protein